MDNNQFNQFNESNPNQSMQMPSKSLLEKIGLGCACGGALLTFIFNIVTCTQSADKSVNSGDFKMSLWIIGVIIAALISIAGIVLAILSREANAPLSKIAQITIIVAAVALVFAILQNATLCGYNCSLNSKVDDKLSSYSSYFN